MAMPETNHAGREFCDPDQRKYPRFSVSLLASFTGDTSVWTGTVVDVSREGCRIRCAGAVPDVKYCRIEIGLGDPSEKLTVELAVMRWSKPGEFGVEFIRMLPDDQERLRRVIRRCEAASSAAEHPEDGRNQSLVAIDREQQAAGHP